MKALRYLVLAVAGLFLLMVIAVGVVLFILDPNDFKPQIESAVEERTNLDLVLDGDIGWSFIPLGLELNEVEATLEGERLVRLEQLIAEVDFWSLIAMSPQVSTFTLDGLDARLKVDENGEGNWTRIMKEAPEDGAGSSVDPEEAPQTADNDVAEEESEGESTPLNFNVEDVNISNAQVHYDDAATGQSVTLENFSLQASQITLGQEFPLSIAFSVALGEPQLDVDGEIDAELSANEALDEFTVSDLDGRFEMAGETFGDETVEAGITGGLTANLTDETASLRGLRVSLANFELETDLNVVGFGDNPQLEGQLDIPAFSLRELLASLGQAEVETDDPDVLEALSFSTTIGGEPGQVELSSLNIGVDDTTFTGNMRYRLDNGAIALNLQGDSFNADRYLPPASDEETAEAEQQGDGNGSANGEAAEEGDLLPLETLRTLALDIDLGLEELIVSNLTITEIATAIDANEGLLELRSLSGKLYEGDFDTNVTIDARKDTPTWDIGGQVNDVATRFLLTDLADMDMLAGAANLNLDIASSGNRVSVLRENADGEISFNLAEGEFTRMNLTRMACQGIALANSEQLTTSDWGNGTPFNDMQGTLQIDGNTLSNTDLVAALAGMELRGDGTVDMKASELDYEVGLRVVGEIHRDQACRVSEYVQDVVIPVECRGNFAEDPAGLCSFDGSRFRDTLKDIAANAARAKVQEETERARERAEERARKEIDERLGEDGDKIKDSIRGLFNR